MGGQCTGHDMTDTRRVSRLTPITVSLGDGLMIALPADDRVFLLNETARFIWDRWIEGIPETEIPTLVASHYGVDIAEASNDARRTFVNWRADGLLRPTDVIHRHCEIAGLPFEICCHDADLDRALAPVLKHLTQSTDSLPSPGLALQFDIESGNGQTVLRKNGIETARATRFDEIIETLTLGIFDYASGSGNWRVSLHAAAVGTESGCVLMPGASGSGKSTLTAALLSLDRVQYHTDDLALLEPEALTVIPVPMPLVLKSGSWDALHPFLPDLADQAIYTRLGKASRYWVPPPERIARKAAPIEAIIFPYYADGADTVLSRIGPFEAMSRIISAPSAVRPPITRQVVEEFASFVQRVPAFALTYGALDEARVKVRGLLSL